jgi:glycosyltransferase involved in cell wall biosynthesis
VATTRHFGGLEIASIRLADLLMRSRSQSQRIVFACRPGQQVEAECMRLGVPTAPLTVHNSGDLGGVAKLIEIVRVHGVQIIHVHSRRDYVTAVLAKASLRRRLGARRAPKLLLHMHLLRALGSPALISGYFFAPNVDRFIAVSEAVRRHLLNVHGQLAPEQVVVVPNSVDVERFKMDRSAGAAVRQRLGIPPDATVVGMVGRLDTKGQNEAIEAIAALHRQDTYLMLVGTTARNQYIERLQKNAAKLGVANRIVFCGARDDVPSYLAAMDIFAHLPVDEAFGLAPAEAMACGLPVLVSNVGGCTELVEDGRTGLMTSPKDVEQIASRMRELADSEPLRQRLAEAGSKFIRERYTPENQAGTLTTLYSELITLDARA